MGKCKHGSSSKLSRPAKFCKEVSFDDPLKSKYILRGRLCYQYLRKPNQAEHSSPAQSDDKEASAT